MKHIGNIQPAPFSTHKKKRVGRGAGSGHGSTATRGTKGQQSRTGYRRKLAFEGGQMPLVRRVPKFGFTSRNRIEYQIVNLSKIEDFFQRGKLETLELDPKIMFESGLISRSKQPVKVLGVGEITKPFSIVAHKFSKSAVKKIESVGGKVTIYG
ncbi:MAG: 50S ribosomal protein L15 [Ignavibacteria bacterium]|nr:50S ribosomal protein L15 [Ignavibacteria bacterium]